MDDSTNNLLVSSNDTVSGSHPTSSATTAAVGNNEQVNNILLVQQQREQQGQDGHHSSDCGQNEQEEEEEAMEEESCQDSSSNVQVPDNIRLVFHSLIKHYSLSKEQFALMYEDYIRTGKMTEQQLQVPQEEEADITANEERAEGDKETSLRTTEELHLHIAEEPILARVVAETESHSSPVTVRNDPLPIQVEGLQGEANRLQSVVQSAMENYSSLPVVINSPNNNSNNTSRTSLSLNDEPLPSTFARELLQRDQSLVAQAIRKYLQQYSIPQREVVEKTGINQSHLSQHFTRGVPIKPAKRVKLYHWFEQDQTERTGKLLTADGSITSVLESPKVEGYRRRPRWRWSPVATQILTEAFKKNRFPTRDQRLELSKICNDAESAMNNGEPIQGPTGDTEGITEQRINTWFTNRRKGLISPSPTASDSFNSLSGLSILTSPSGNIDTPTSETTPMRPHNATSPLTINFTNSTPSSSAGPAVTAQESGISITTPLSLSPINLQALINQLQGQQASALAPILAQNLGQILVGQLPQGLMLQSPHGNTISLETLAKQLNVVDTLTATGSHNDTNNDDGSNNNNNNKNDMSMTDNSGAEQEIIISNIVQPSAINITQD